MHNAHFWHKLHLHRKKIILFSCFIFILSGTDQVMAQNIRTINLPNSDEKWLHYGFTLGVHNANYKLKYSREFTNSDYDTVLSINPTNQAGFSLGFLLNLRLAKHFDLRLLPKVGFYEHELQYDYISGKSETQQVESTLVEFPLLLKYKSQRRGNLRAYMVGGVNPSFKAGGNRNQELSDDRLITGTTNFAIEYGFGVDIYYPLFKFSPEIRFSHGLVNMLKDDTNRYGEGINRLTMHSVSLYLHFSD